MDERMMQFRVGAIVLATVLLAGIMVLLFGEMPTFTQRTYTVYIHFPATPGVNRDTPVKKSGILIGRVTSRAFAEHGGVLVTCAIDDGMTLHENEIPRIVRSVLGGDATIEFVESSDPDLPDKVIEPGQLVPGIVGSDPLDVVSNLEGDLSIAIRSIAATSDEIGSLVRRFNSMLESNDDQLARIIDKTEATIDQLNVTVTGINDIFGDSQSRDRLRESLQEAPELIREIRDTFKQLDRTIALADKNLENLTGLTEPLGQKGGTLVANVDATVEKLDRLMEDLLQFSGRLRNPQGTIGQLLDNPDLYHNLNQAAENVACLTRELRPIIEDARVISDKIARHPEDLGVRGLISGSRSGIK